MPPGKWCKKCSYISYIVKYNFLNLINLNDSSLIKKEHA